MAQPIFLLREFANRLGWRGLTCDSFTLTAVNCGAFAPGTVINSYHTTDFKYFLQINENPIGQTTRYKASIAASRYALRALPWCPFTITDDESVVIEAIRLTPLLSRRLLRDVRSRRRFLCENPHFVLPHLIGRRAYHRLSRDSLTIRST
jgi:hypothetical protein